MTYKLHPAADAELTNAAQYYSSEASLRVAHAFLDEFVRVALLIEEDQLLGKATKDGLRIFPFQKFPYSLIYRELKSGPLIYAVAHQRREPEYWSNRI